LALAALGAVLLRGRRAALVGVVVAAAAVAVAAVWLRADVGRLEPLALRGDNWRTAMWAWSTAPVAGVGLGGFGQVAQLVPFEVGNRPAYAHCLPLQALAELGPVGLAVVVLAAGGFVRLLVRLWPQHPELTAALAVIPAHNLVDFSLLVSGVALPWAVLVGWGVARSRGRAEGVAPPGGRVAAVALAGITLVVVALHGTSIVVERAAAAEARAADRYDRAWSSWRTAPWRVPPALLVASTALEMGDRSRCNEASRLLGRVSWWRPGSAVIASLESGLAVRRGAASEAVTRAWLARRRRPFDPRPAHTLEDLLDQLETTRNASP
jgi:O-antigen ligase